jgi:hypothetical protein
MSLVVGISHLVYKYIFIYVGSIVLTIGSRGRGGDDRILFGFTTTYAISVITNSANAEVWQVCGFILELTATV